MQLYVLYRGEQHPFEVDESMGEDPIEYVCSQVAAAVGIEADTFTLLFDGKPLRDRDDIMQLSEDNTIEMTLRESQCPTMDLSWSNALSNRGDGFLAHHTWLTTITLPQESDVEDIGNEFLKGCSG